MIVRSIFVNRQCLWERIFSWYDSEGEENETRQASARQSIKESRAITRAFHQQASLLTHSSHSSKLFFRFTTFGVFDRLQPRRSSLRYDWLFVRRLNNACRKEATVLFFLSPRVIEKAARSTLTPWWTARYLPCQYRCLRVVVLSDDKYCSAFQRGIPHHDH